MLLEEQLFAPRPVASPTEPAPSAPVPAPPVPERHSWPALEGAPGSADPYDIRPDDVVVSEMRRGEGFMRRFGLDGPAPEFAAARAGLLADRPQLTLCNAAVTPDVSIVIPVFGQLAHTLNCLDSLRAHTSRHSAEIIVVDDASPDETAQVLHRLPGLRLLRQKINAGFIASCNAGVAAARGGIIVLLNNDTRVAPGWLDALVDSFDLFPEAGLVGAKLFHADGSLQEAGGIVWRDGSAWNYGRGDDPNRPRYCHARQVDYVSGASIALPRALWQQLGGLDAHFAPAYAEDADLALRVHAAGRQVWFQPLARVVHYEGVTSGTDTRQGVKAWQPTNMARLYLRWRETLARHSDNGELPYKERDRGLHQRALVVDATTPTPQQDAGSVTTVMHLQMLQTLGYKTYFVPQDNALFQPGPTGELQRMGVECLYAPYEIGFETIMARYGAQFDLVLVFRVTVLGEVIASIRTHAPQATLLFNNMDLHFLRMRREAELAGDDAAAWEDAQAMQNREIGLIQLVDCTMTPSSFEQAEIARLAPEATTMVMPFIADFHGTSAPFSARRDICFLGGYRHTPNIDAALWFVREILPLLRAAEPGIRFIIAGAHPTAELQALAGPDIVVTGMVPDLRDVFDTTRVFACSLRAGAGVKGKIVSAMAYGLPVVSTSVGAEGMDLVDESDALLADDAAAFAAACLRLYRDPLLWQRLSDAGQQRVRTEWSQAHGTRVLRRGIDAGTARRLGVSL